VSEFVTHCSIAPGLVAAQAHARSGSISDSNNCRFIVVAMGVCPMDTISGPVVANTVLISERERGILVPYSFKVTRIVFLVAIINRVATTEEHILGFRPSVIHVLELRDLNLNAGPVLNYDPMVPASGH
jgi:hypothetical protein